VGTIHIAESTLRVFVTEVFTRLAVPPVSAALAAQSLVEASLLGIDTHGIELLDMYVAHLRAGGLKADAEPICLQRRGGVQLWDIQHGFGLAAGRVVMSSAIQQARSDGICLATCRNANHLGACGVYAKMATDEGLIGIASQQTLASLAPWGGREVLVGTSPFALVAPVKDAFPFYFDASMAAVTRGQIRIHRRTGKPLPEGVALDAEGRPTRDPEQAWQGQIMPIGGHKGVGLAMAFEILSCLLSGNQFSQAIPSIVDHPERSADSSFFMMAIDSTVATPLSDFAAAMKRYVDYVESSMPRTPDHPPRYPGRREGEIWLDRSQNGIPISAEGKTRLDRIAASLSLAPVLCLNPQTVAKSHASIVSTKSKQ
jgi:LDH2 family malate/lactate/ureidoglycolate dehydrogenase